MNGGVKAVEGAGGRLKFTRDYSLRRRLFGERSFEHKAKTNLYWLAWLVDRYSLEGEIVVDPCGGTGSVLLGVLKGRRVVTGDIEVGWALLQRENLVRLGLTQLFVVPGLVCVWDGGRLPLRAESVGCVVTSPPYFDMWSNWNRKGGSGLAGRFVDPERGSCYGFSDRQIGNIHVYDDYLGAMRGVYGEVWRVLDPGGRFVLIVGDRVRRGRVVRVTDDAEALCCAVGFNLVSSYERATIPSQYRNIHARRGGEGYPVIGCETALVFEKGERRLPRRLVIVQAPRANRRPGRQLFGKALVYGGGRADWLWVMTKEYSDGLHQGEDGLGVGPGRKVIWSGDHGSAGERKDWCYGVVRNLVMRGGLVAGDEVELHVSLRYARYLERRLNSFGARAVIPTARLNMGQKLRFYTQALMNG